MRRRSAPHRLSSTVLGVWFALISVAPNSWRPCPTHGSAEDAAHHGVARAAGAAASSMAGMQCEHAAEATTSPAKPMPRHGAPAAPHPCDCPPSCSSVPAVARLDTPVSVEVPTVRHVADATIIEPAIRRVPSTPRLLPFANGPPGVSAG